MDEIKNSEDLPAITNDFLFHLLIALILWEIISAMRRCKVGNQEFVIASGKRNEMKIEYDCYFPFLFPAALGLLISFLLGLGTISKIDSVPVPNPTEEIKKREEDKDSYFLS